LRRPIVTVVKALSPAGDSGRFNLKVGTTVVKAGAGDGDRGSLDVGYGSDVTVSEVATAGTDAAEIRSALAAVALAARYGSQSRSHR